MHESPQRFLLFFVVFILIMNYFSPEPKVNKAIGNVLKKTAVVKKGPVLFDKKAFIQNGFDQKTRIKIESQLLMGSINLVGPSIDDLRLLGYKKKCCNDSLENSIELLSPGMAKSHYYVAFEWPKYQRIQKAEQENLNFKDIEFPNKFTVWKSNSELLKVGQPVELSWENKQGVKFILEIALDDSYVFTIKYIIKNAKSIFAGQDVVVQTSVNIARDKGIVTEDNAMSHEGGIVGDKSYMKEIRFSDVKKKFSGAKKYIRDVDFAGFSDKYWFVGAIQTDIGQKRYLTIEESISRNEVQQFEMKFKANTSSSSDGVTIKGEDAEVNSDLISTFKVFAGPKKLNILRFYSKSLNLPTFERIVDFGVLYFVTKPIFVLLSFLCPISGNFGVAILLLTVLLKIILFPLAYIAHTNTEKIRELTPKIDRLKRLYSSNAQILQKNIMALYKKKKVHPFSAFLPTIIQIPIFFALYKVLYVSIEMRHAPFGLWIKDLSSKDPTSVLTLFGLIKLNLPSFLQIGILPILMSLTMLLQQKMTLSTVHGSEQNKFFKFLPLIFLFIFASFPSGLLLYWVWSNLLVVLQHKLIIMWQKKSRQKK